MGPPRVCEGLIQPHSPKSAHTASQPAISATPERDPERTLVTERHRGCNDRHGRIDSLYSTLMASWAKPWQKARLVSAAASLDVALQTSASSPAVFMLIVTVLAVTRFRTWQRWNFRNDYSPYSL